MATLASTLAIRSPVFGQSLLHVDAASGSDSNSGATWATAKASLQGALTIAAAATGPVEIRVKQYPGSGAYVPSAKLDPSSSDNRLRSFYVQAIDDDVNNYLDVRGGYPSSISSPTPDDRNGLLYRTRLSGDQGSGLPSYHVVTTGLADERTRLDGFDVSGGSGSDGEEEGFPDYLTDPNDIGGGVFCLCPPPSSVEDLIFWRPLIANCFIHDNQSSLGGGIGGAGIAPGMRTGRRKVSVVVQVCHIFDNSAATGGGIGMETSDIEASNSLLHGNRADFVGGGIYGAGSTANALIRGCTISGNFLDEETGTRGGGLYVGGADGSQAQIWNSIIYWNSAPQDGVLNQIASAGPGGNPSGTAFIAPFDSCIGDFPVPNGQNVINDDPDFIDLSNDDFRLSATSPCIDIGKTDVPAPPYESYLKMPEDEWDVDDDGVTDELLPAVNRKRRDRGCAMDIGAHERSLCEGDLNDSGLVDGVDLGIVLGAWGPLWGNSATDSENSSDINEDGIVNGADLALVTGSYNCTYDCGENSLMSGDEGAPNIDLLAAAEVYGFTDLHAFGLWLGIDGPVVAMELLSPFTSWGGES